MNKFIIAALLIHVSLAGYAIQNDVCCETGNYLDANGNCTACAAWCATCTYSNMDHTNVADTGCGPAVQNCQVQTAVNECVTCMTGYIVNTADKSCVACGNNCATCTLGASTTTCTTCTNTNTMHAAGTDCVTMMTNCQAMTANAATCATCSAGYYPNATPATSCTACPTNCATCTNATTCQTCVTPPTGSVLALPAAMCVTCITGCSDCPNATTCTTCAAGYVLNGTVCDACTGTNVATCTMSNNAQVIATCNAGSYLATNPAACTPCPTGTVTCSATAGTIDTVTCVQNVVPAYVANAATNPTGCQQCSANATACNAAGDVASDCEQPYKIVSNACATCGANVMTCTASGTNAGDIQACVAGKGGIWATNKFTDCSQTCPNNCSICKGTADGTTGAYTVAVCDTCVAATTTGLGWYKGSDGTCTACTDVNCSACANTNAATCETCMAKYWLNGTTCSPCIQNCDACSNGTTCTTCTKSNTNPLTGDGTEYIKGTDNTCHVAQIASQCATTGQFYDTAATAKICTNCMSFCDVCTNATACTTCRNGYGYVSNACTACTVTDDNLMRCDNNLAQISNCKSGYAIATDKLSCTGCIQNCTQCNTTPATKCDDTMCADGYYQNQDMTSCLACAERCKSCSATCIKGCHVCWDTTDATITTANDCNCPSGKQFNNTTHLCETIPDTPAPSNDSPSTSSSYGNIMRFSLYAIVLIIAMYFC